MEIRRITEADDFAAIGNIYVRSWRTAYRGIVPQAHLDSLSAERWADNFRAKVSHGYVLLDGEQYLGCATVCPARDASMPGWGELVSIYLLPEYYDRGLGGLLIQAAEDGLREMGFHQIYLWTMTQNGRARRFYEKHGYALNGDEHTFSIAGAEIAEVRYIKEV